MNLFVWARQWGIPEEAILQLRMLLGQDTAPAPGDPGMPESLVQKRVRFDASGQGEILWRNNVGAYQDQAGNWVRYGLANDSKQMNQKVKSSDLIGIRPVRITQDHLGTVVGQFIARECKHSGWVWKGTEHERAQEKFLQIVASYGGDGKFAN